MLLEPLQHNSSLVRWSIILLEDSISSWEHTPCKGTAYSQLRSDSTELSCSVLRQLRVREPSIKTSPKAYYSHHQPVYDLLHKKGATVRLEGGVR